MISDGRELIGFLTYTWAIVVFSGIISLPFVSVRLKPIITGITVFLTAFFTGIIAVNCFTTGDIEFIINGGIFFGKIPFRIDALAAWFILIVNITSVTGILYGSGYLKTDGVKSAFVTTHWILYVLFQSSMLLVCMVQHSIAFIMAWELMSLSSFMLVLYDYTNPKVIKAGINYLVQMHLSVVLLTVAFIWVYIKTGTFDFKGIGMFFGSEVNIWLFLVFFVGFGLKSGFLGMHTWLPQAHPAAPSHVSGVMSGVIVKMGIYGIFRIIFNLRSDFLVIGEIILTVSLLTGLFGIMNAAVHRDFKKMLAYCTIENIGIIGIGIGIGMIGMARNQNLLVFLGFGGALLHVLNHSLFKSLLFFSSGSVYMQTHTRDMDKLGGIIKFMPKTGLMFLIGALAIGGIPPFNGFISEFLIYCGILKGMGSEGVAQTTLMISAFAGLSLIGGISILTFTKTFSAIFLGVPRQTLHSEPKETSVVMLIPMYIIVILMLTVALFPTFFLNIMGIVLGRASMADINNIDIKNYVSMLSEISKASFIFIGLTILLFLLKRLITRKAEVTYSSTWGCAYTSPNRKMQYTGKSFSKSFGKILNFIIIEKKGYSEIDRTDTFPEERKYSSYYLDFFETKIIDPFLNLIFRFINIFQFIQNGKIQAYVLYGILFIIAIFIGTVLNFW